MSSLATSQSPLTPLQVAARLLAVDPTVLVAYMAAQSSLGAGEALLAAQSTADLQRTARLPRSDRRFNDVFRTR